MHFDLLESISLAGDAGSANDDRCGAGDAHAWVIDGATDLGPPGLVGARGGAAWLAARAQRAFAGAEAESIEALCAGVADQLAVAFAAERTRDPIDRWELPIAAFLAVRLAGTMLECGWLGDCIALHRRGDTLTRIGPPREAGAAETDAARSLAQHGLGAVQRSAPILEALRASRNRPGRRVLGVEPETMHHLNTLRIDCAPGDHLLLMTDGFAALIDAYDALDEAGLMAALPPRRLAALATELRAIEQADAACTRYPRFKRSDDATALWLRVAG